MNTKQRIIFFEGIDSFNRPVFRSVGSKNRYGSTSKLFDYNTPGEEVIKNIDVSDLVFFGNEFDCEPDGSKPSFNLCIKE